MSIDLQIRLGLILLLTANYSLLTLIGSPDPLAPKHSEEW
jgi:hypothetical protein